LSPYVTPYRKGRGPKLNGKAKAERAERVVQGSEMGTKMETPKGKGRRPSDWDGDIVPLNEGVNRRERAGWREEDKENWPLKLELDDGNRVVGEDGEVLGDGTMDMEIEHEE
jgi:hypothetical protein